MMQHERITMPHIFRVGKKVVYPAHGVALIEAIEEKVVSGCRQSFYILRVLGNDTTIMIPTHNATRVGLRDVIGPSEIPRVMEILRRKDVEISPTWNRRFKDNWERISSGVRRGRPSDPRARIRSWVWPQGWLRGWAHSWWSGC